MSKRLIYRNPKLVGYVGDFDFDGVSTIEDVYASDLEKLYNQFELKIPKEESVYNLTYVGSNNDFIMFDGGFKDYVRVENRIGESKYLKNTTVGENVDVMIVNIDESNYFILGSISIMYENRAHANLKSIPEGQSVFANVRELTPAGYNIDIQYEGITLPGFMPNTLAGINKLYDPNSIIGKTFDVMIESFAKDEGTYIVSRRKYLQSLIPSSIKDLKNGVVYSGNVTGTTEFGVFVEFNECLTGMIHKTNLNPEWQEKMTLINPGFEIEFYIKEIIKDRIILTQILRETIWDTIKIGQTLTGRVRDTKQFGTLVSLDAETIGLIHNSEMEKSNTKRLNAGDNIKVKVISIDRSNRKIFLSVA
jgi:ribosomal protein S1